MRTEPKGRSRRIASGVVFWSSMLVIGILAVPTVILLGAISAIRKGTEILLKKLAD